MHVSHSSCSHLHVQGPCHRKQSIPFLQAMSSGLIKRLNTFGVISLSKSISMVINTGQFRSSIAMCTTVQSGKTNSASGNTVTTVDWTKSSNHWMAARFTSAPPRNSSLKGATSSRSTFHPRNGFHRLFPKNLTIQR